MTQKQSCSLDRNIFTLKYILAVVKTLPNKLIGRHSGKEQQPTNPPPKPLRLSIIGTSFRTACNYKTFTIYKKSTSSIVLTGDDVFSEKNPSHVSSAQLFLGMVCYMPCTSLDLYKF